ncbi:MAG TPA: TIR domain-containing protein [Acidimicrobiales bacterium]|nr:TIR domain-containing protein [Acidimicrobiales bacterium]
MEGGTAYDAFISYSHAADGRLAPALQTTLQRYAKPWYRRRVLRVFRDQTGLSANPHLWTSIVEALDGSRWFILLSSPDAARSEWVGKEIAHWVEHKGPDRILPVVTDGTWAWDAARGDLDERSTAVHPALIGTFTEEPRHVDLTWAHSEVQVDPRDGRFLDAVAELAAPLRGVAKDELAGEEVRQHRRTVRTAWAAASTMAVLLVLALVAGTLALVQRDEARDQRTRAEDQTEVATARSLSAQAIAQASVRVDTSLLLGVEGVRRDRSPETVAGLLTGLNGAARLVGFRPELTGDVAALEASPDGTTVATAEPDGRVRLFEVDGWQRAADVRVDDLGLLGELDFVDGALVVVGTRGARVLSLPDLEPVRDAVTGTGDLSTVAVAPDGRRAAVTDLGGTEVELRDLSAGTTTGRAAVPCTTGVTALAWSPAGDALAATCDDLAVALLDPASGAVLGQRGAPGGSALAFSPDGARLAVVGADAVTVLDRTTLGPVAEGIAVPRPRTARFSADGGQVVVGAEGRVLVWDVDEDRRVDELVGVDEGVVGLAGLPERHLLVGTRSTVSEWQLGQVPPLAAGVGDGTDVLAVDGRGTRYGPVPDADGLRATGATGEVTDVELPGAVCAVNPSPGGEAAVVSSAPGGAGTAVTELRRLPSGEVLASLTGALRLTTCSAAATAFSPDGRRLAAVGPDGRAAVWDVGVGEVEARGSLEDGASAIGWSSDGRSIVTGEASGAVRVWSTDGDLREAEVIPLVEGSPISGVEPVDGEDQVVVTVETGEIHVVDLGDADTVGKPFRWGGTELRGGRISPDGRVLAAIGRNGNLRLWDVRSHTVLGPGLRAFPRGDAARLTFTADDELATWDGIGAALRWRLDVDAWADTACVLAGRRLTEEEWEQYLPGEPYDPACGGAAA